MKNINRNTMMLVIGIIIFILVIILSMLMDTKASAQTLSVEGQLTLSELKEKIYHDGEVYYQKRLSELYEESKMSDEDVAEISSEIDDEIPVEPYSNIGYAIAKLNIRSQPSFEGTILDHLYFNDEIQYDSFNDRWLAIPYGSGEAYVYAEYISDTPSELESKPVLRDVRKSYEDYRGFADWSRQYKLQSRASTSNFGIRIIDGRYCVALGSYYSHNIGQYVDVVLENGLVIPCVVADAKADIHTIDNHTRGLDGGCVEFIVDIKSLSSLVRYTGDCSDCLASWDSPVVEILLYEYEVNL